jgi:flagellum-specific ATP synthase
MDEILQHTMTAALTGRVIETVGNTAAVANFPAPVGAVVEVERASGGPTEGEVIGFRENFTLVFLFTGITGVRHGNRVCLTRTARSLRVGPNLLGRVVDAHGNPIDGRPRPMLTGRSRLDRRPPLPTERPPIDTPLSTGIRAVDTMLSCGRGQRLGIFSGSGVGKSVLLGMMCKQSEADVIVIGLVGERGREVNEFLDRELGRKGLARAVVVVATSNEPALRRTQAAFTATAIAEYFRDQGKNVLLLFDSITRFAMAQREIGLAAGEPPTTRGYPPSVFSALPKLLERAGRGPTGSITACYSVLVEGDDPAEPVADAIRGLLDGHICLSRQLAARGHYPAIDVLESVSRLMTQVATPTQLEAARTIRKLLVAYRDNEDLLSIGAYRHGTNREVDVAVEMRNSIDELLQQHIAEAVPPEEARSQLVALARTCDQKLASPPTPIVAPDNAPIAQQTKAA